MMELVDGQAKLSNRSRENGLADYVMQAQPKELQPRLRRCRRHSSPSHNQRIYRYRTVAGEEVASSLPSKLLRRAVTYHGGSQCPQCHLKMGHSCLHRCLASTIRLVRC